ncbi:MAG: SAM-dependent methyltransferase [Rhodocyclaceae bacterium]
MSVTLPEPSPEARSHSDRVCEQIAREIGARGGWLAFSRYMELALYAPGLGYYAAGARKFGASGDFVTAPEITSLFGQALAAQLREIMGRSAPALIEVGAGTGALAADLLEELALCDALPESYAILEVSADLRQRQADTLRERDPRLAGRVRWITSLPERFSGAILANEVLDVMPVQVLAWRSGGLFECGVALDEHGGFRWEERPAHGHALEYARRIAAAPPYRSEICLASRAWIRAWAGILERGALLLIDYGFPRREYYHPQRSAGTLRCHYRHRAHDDPFFLPGLNDITSHVDFTSVAEAGVEAGLELLGYCPQAAFLLDCGILDILARIRPESGSRYLKAAADVQRLINPAEMGELFKVMALGRSVGGGLLGFRSAERSHTL